MRSILFISMITVSAFMWSCESMYDKQEQYEGEIVYPAKYDTVIGHIGFERVEIDLMKAGRIPSDKINMGKAEKTRIEYDDQVITIDSLVSYVNITGLSQSKLYRFNIFTIDKYENKSVPQEIALIPFTQGDLASFVIAPPRIMASPTAAAVDWPGGISSVLMDYYGLKFEYTDKNGEVQTGERGADSRFFIANVEAGQQVEISMEYKIIPKINGTPILDTVIFEGTLVINMPTGSTPFSPTERAILEANGITEFTADGVSDIEELTYPIHANSLQDIFYFSNLKTLDLTGGDLFQLPELHYDRDGVQDMVGGDAYAPFMRKAGDISSGNRQALKDLLEAGLLEKVYYRPNTMGLDDLLAPYVDSDVVELVEGPESVPVENQFHLDGNVQDGNWNMDITYPATDAPEGTGIENVYKVVCKATSSSFVLALPKEYQFNPEEYRYFKMMVYAPEKSSFEGEYEKFQCFWPRIMNHMWAFGDNSNFGQEYWDMSHICMDDADLENWTEVTLDMSEATGRHNRVLVLNIGTEPWIDFDRDIVYYLANMRFTKNP